MQSKLRMRINLMFHLRRLAPLSSGCARIVALSSGGEGFLWSVIRIRSTNNARASQHRLKFGIASNIQACCWESFVDGGVFEQILDSLGSKAVV
uniref:50S ribosomal protein 36 n=1 Tax=Gymnochlora stellata TaxID=67809 RepID=B5A4J6_GYMST|nr:50S ribosomal protein 36 [Gymnochlora stellata]